MRVHRNAIKPEAVSSWKEHFNFKDEEDLKYDFYTLR